MKWEKVKLGDVCEITSSKRIFYSEYVDDGVPFYRSKEIIESDEGKIIENPLYISVDKYNEIKEKFGVPQTGDMLLTSVGTIGIPYIIKKKDCFYFKDGNLTWFRDFREGLNSKYLYYWIKSSEGTGTLYNTTIGSSQKALTISALKNIKVSLPPRSVQDKIVEVVSVYDDLIENNQKQIKLLEEAAQRLYKEWFVDLRFPGHENTKIVDGVPEGWQYEKLGDLVKTTSGGTPSRRKSEYYVNGNIRWIKTKELNDGFIFETEEHITEDAVKNSSAKVLPEGALIVAMYGATIGKIGITAAEMACNQACCAFISFDDMISKEYLYCWLMDNREYLVSQGKGAAQSNLSQEMIRNFSLLCPDKKVIKNFTEIVTTMLENKRVLENKILMLSKARDDLLPKLMSGEVEV